MTDAPYPTDAWPGDRPEIPRPPGRVFFDPDGYEHLRGIIDTEVADLMRQPMNGMTPCPRPRSGHPARDSADRALGELAKSIGAAGALFGPAVSTALNGAVVLGRVERVGDDVGELDERLATVESAYASDSSEVERLTRELARAQVAYDTARRTSQAHLLQTGELRRVLRTALDELTVQRALAEVFLDELRSALRYGRLSRDARSVGSVIGNARRRALKLAHARRHPTQEDTDD